MSEDESRVFPEWAKPFVANVSTLVWEELRNFQDAKSYRHVLSHMTVLVSGGVEADGKLWLHVSCAMRNRLPSWEELKMVKETFIGKDKQALQILPVEEKYVNYHPNCLHLWHCVTGDGLPDFTVGRPPGVI